MSWKKKFSKVGTTSYYLLNYYISNNFSKGVETSKASSLKENLARIFSKIRSQRKINGKKSLLGNRNNEYGVSYWGYEASKRRRGFLANGRFLSPRGIIFLRDGQTLKYRGKGQSIGGRVKHKRARVAKLRASI